MSGHSKWANIKHRKGARDAKKSALFSKLSRGVEIAARGGAEPEKNIKLKLAIEKARAANMPGGSIEKAIRKGAGLDKEKSELIEATYEGFGPGGAALVVEVLTDNRNRAGAEIRHIFSLFGGSLAAPGAVAWQFANRGKLIVQSEKNQKEKLALKAIDLGASDVEEEGEETIVYTDPKEVMAVKEGLLREGFVIKEASIVLVAKNFSKVDDRAEAEKLLKLMGALDEHPDVQEVYSNFDIPDSLLEDLT